MTVIIRMENFEHKEHCLFEFLRWDGGIDNETVYAFTGSFTITPKTGLVILW